MEKTIKELSIEELKEKLKQEISNEGPLLEELNVELKERLKQEFLNRTKDQTSDQPDVQTILAELLQKTQAIDGDQLPSNLDRMDQMKFAYVMAKKYTSGLNVTVHMHENIPFMGMGSVHIEGSFLEFRNPEFFARMAEFSDNTDIYSLLNGMIRITFTFHNIARKHV